MSPLRDIYNTLYKYFGPQHWWPGDSVLEIMVGAILTQNTNWENVSRAIANLKENNLLSLGALAELPLEHLAEKIRPAGYYNIKAARLKNLLNLIKKDCNDCRDPRDFLDEDREILREKLLAVKGIGPETADSILLYAAGKPVFVVDAYTYRIFLRHGLIPEESTYGEIQELFQDGLEEDVYLFNEYHALLVRLGKTFCKKTKPLCSSCPLRSHEPIVEEYLG
ncbi:MAG: endonuclease III domain-containing protein [Thermodesulfobacteriota bacterium]